ncbi:MAG: hydrogenase 4 subunit B [Chloroflexi bacterium]|nr:hydrogenase 4 subunit B [Chloroflexota bacterium]
MFDATLVLIVLVAIHLAGAVAVYLTRQESLLTRQLNGIFGIAGGVMALILALIGLQRNLPGSGSTVLLSLEGVMPFAPLEFTLDRLSSFFLLLIAVVGIPVSLYSIDYMREYVSHPDQPGAHAYNLGLFGVAYQIFILSMILVVLASTTFTFLFLWELMALASYFLVVFEHRHRDTQEAGTLYLIMTHLGFVALFIGFMLLSGPALVGNTTLSFSELRISALALPSTQRDIVFLLMFIGFGSKAGMIPFHVWLPQAHPAAPSPVSALMSGVMIKLGIYGLLRITLDLLGGGPGWWGGLILVVGGASALYGILYALVDHNLKRLLAYSSVENAGIILLASGAALVFWSAGNTALATLALVGALYHILNHGVFKSLLFMGAGAVLQSTHTLDMESLGGLIKRMPWTALFFLVGSVSIAALPPFNGFVGEWIILQSLLLSLALPSQGAHIFLTLGLGALALTGGLVAAAFVKAFGISFLALPRSAQADQATEAPRLMRWAMGINAVLCLLLGLLATLLLPALQGISRAYLGPDQPTVGLAISGLEVRTGTDFGSLSPLLLGILLALLALIALWGLRLAGINELTRRSMTWACGRFTLSPRMEYTATAFANPLKRIFAFLYQPVRALTIETPGASPHFAQDISYRNPVRLWFEEYLYGPVARGIVWLARRASLVQHGSLHLYLTYILSILVILLVLTRG